ncbi:MAG: hypothetical protein AAF235_11120 [Planctomycetota bacterium]
MRLTDRVGRMVLGVSGVCVITVGGLPGCSGGDVRSSTTLVSASEAGGDAQPARRVREGRPGRQAGGPRDGIMGADMGETLVKGLKETEGCYDAKAAQVQGGQLSIFAWFEDKAAAMRWHQSAVHQRFMQMGGAMGLDPAEGEEPMAEVPDDIPLMVIATITPNPPEKIRELGSPLGQISIELFRTVPGGAAFNGRLSPEAFPVDHMAGLGG